MKFAVDLDGTLAATVESVLDLYNAEYGTHYTTDAVTQWHFWNSLPELQSLPEPKRRDKILRYMDRAWNEGLVEPRPGAAEFMRELREYGQADIVTGRGEGTPTSVIEAWLDIYGIPHDEIVRVRGGSRGKVFHPYNSYTDDDPTLALDIAAHWPQKRVFLIDQTWNREVPDSRNVRRIFSLLQAIPSDETRQMRPFRRPDQNVHVRRHQRRT